MTCEAARGGRLAPLDEAETVAREGGLEGRRHAERRVILSVVSKVPPQDSFRRRPHHCALRHIFE